MTNSWTGGQYSVYRVLLGAWLLVRLALMPMDGALSGILVAAGIVLCLPLMLGWRDRVAAGALAVIQLALLGLVWQNILGVFPWIASIIAIVLPVLHMFSPAAPYGSWAARGRGDPDSDWRLAKVVFALVWIVLSAIYLLSALYLLTDPDWRNGQPEQVAHLPVGFGRLLSFVLLSAWFAFAPLALIAGYRKWVWLGALVIDVVVLPIMGYPGAAIALVMLHLLAFDPAWLPTRKTAEPEAIFYDGYCGLCHRWVRFVLAEDRAGDVFILSPLQGELIKQKIAAAERETLPDSIVVLRGDGDLLTRSAAILHILSRLGGLWRIASWLGRLIPRPLRDAVYAAIAAIRHHVFRRPTEACPITPEHLRGRFQV